MQVKGLTNAVAGAACAAALAAAPLAAQARQVPDSFAPVARDLMPAVVNISTTQTVERETGPLGQLPPGHPLREFFEQFKGQQGPKKRELHSLGSGFIVDEDGYVVTNHHVIRKADKVTVVLDDDTKLDAEIVGTDPKTDLAVLKVKTDRELPSVDWGNSRKAEIGDWVLAIGNPFGLGGSVTAGIVSARGRDINAGPYSRFIQTDTAINRGNSGGPLFNLDGKVIGVNTAILSPNGGSVGVGFALPARVAQPIVSELREDGEVTRGWLGVTVQPVTDDLAAGLDLPEDKGALVGNTAKGGPAAEAGLKQGDVIVSLGGKAVEDAGQLAWLVSQRDPGDEVELKLWRDGEKMTKTVKLGELSDAKMARAAPGQQDKAGKAVAKALGLQLAPAKPQVLEQFDLPSGIEGAVVARVARGGPAASRGIRAGDVITQVGRRDVDSPKDVRRLIAKGVEEGADGVVLLVQRGNKSQFVSVPLAQPETG
jgi:serine protease Do